MNKSKRLVALVITACCSTFGQGRLVNAAPTNLTSYIATLNYFSGGLQRYDANTGVYIDTIGSLPIRRSELNLGPDGNFYITIFSFSNQFEIKRIDANTGVTTQFIDASPFGEFVE
jgi:hypothetical protein